MAVEIFQIDPNLFLFQEYSPQETSLINSVEVNTYLNSGSYIENFLYTLNSDLISSNYNFNDYTILNDGQSPGTNGNIVTIDINVTSSSDLLPEGTTLGQYVSYYNFLQKEIGSNIQELYISEISSDRTEVRLDSTSLTILDILEQASNLIQKRENSPYFLDFYLNFGNNQLVIANNIQLDTLDPANPTILVKLYEALPEEFNVNSPLWVVTLIEEPIAYQINELPEPIVVVDTVPLNGPNFNISIKDQINNSTLSLSYLDLVNTSLTSSQLQLNSLLEEKEIDINIDYSNFSNFIHFSSAQTRLENFYNKVILLEQYSSSINTVNSTSTNTSSSVAYYENLINNIIQNFDGYEYYLYYSSGSTSYPKITNEQPYLLYPSNNVQVLTWLGSTNEASPYYGGLTLSASIFDNENKDNLLFTIPEYLRDDPQNQPYELFVEMVAQHYDNIWIYYKDVTEKYNADNRLEYGVSKDIVADAIRDFGIKLYQNNFSNEDLYTAFLGLTPEGALFPFPNITGSLPTPSGFEYVDTLISASNDYIPLDDVNKSLYKRIYHNIPYLLKSKGTLPGLRALITSYGIPDTVLRINEFGGKDKSNTNDWDYWEDTFNYTFYTTGSNFAFATWAPINPLWDTNDGVADSVVLRFKTNGLPEENIPYSQSLWNVNGDHSHLVLRYTGSGYISSSLYPGSIPNPYNKYAHLDFYPSYNIDPTISASVYLPFFDGGWWSAAINRKGTDFTLLVGNKIYEGGNNGTSLGFYATSSVIADDAEWVSYGTSYFARGNVIINNDLYNSFSGSLQEIRYYTSPLSESIFKDYIMNPHSTEGNTLNSSPNELIFRASLGGELYTGSNSIHPKVTGSWALTSSFISDSLFNFVPTPVFTSNTEYFFYDQVAAGIKNAVSDKIRVEDGIYPSGSTLSPFRSLSQNLAVSQSYTANTNLLEVAFSPQDEINQDIMDQIGYFNIGEFIGDPRLRSSSATSYPALDRLRNEYFEKYISNYDLNDYIRLIKFFDNSLFKMIKDFVPARTSLASGVVIKQHLLERNKYPQPQVDNHSTIAYYTSGSNPPSGSGSINNIPLVFQNIAVSGTIAPQWNDYNPGTIENFSGGTGGTFEMFNGVDTSPYGPNGTGPQNIFFLTQSWNEGIVTPLGVANTTHDAQDEFYDGEFSGSVLTITTQSLFAPYPLDNIASSYRQVHYYSSSSIEGNIFESLFLNTITAPQSGSILFYNEPAILFGSPSYQAFITKYLKIARIDCNGNDNTNVLENVDKTLIFNDVIGQYIEYDLAILNEQSTYYLYESTPKIYIPSLFPNQVLNYGVSASNASTAIPTSPNPLFQTPITTYGNTTGNTLGYFNSTTGVYTLGNTPNTRLTVTGSVIVAGSGVGKFFITLLRQGTQTLLQDANISAGNSYSISASYYGLQGDQIFLGTTFASGVGPLEFKSGSLLLTQSRALSSSNCAPVIFEPYITSPNWYYSDYNPLMNNINALRLSTTFEQVDYYPGITTPTNFDLIISGSALKAAVQDSNYTSKRVINPRYNGVKSTSQHLNYWTPGDTGTYGKTPTAQSLKTAVAYCDWIGGWPPDRENASAIHVQYLIKSDGSIIIPDVSQYSLFENKGNFESGEKVLISSKTVSSGQPQQFRNVIRGGSRIEPILYTQSGSAPNVSWNTSMSFSNIVPSTNSASADYTALFSQNGNVFHFANDTFHTVPTDLPVYGASYLSGTNYVVPASAVQDGVSLTFEGKVRVKLQNSLLVGPIYTIRLTLLKNGLPIYTTPPSTVALLPSINDPIIPNYLSYSVPAANLVAGDIYGIQVQVNENNFIFIGTYTILGGSNLKVTQYPLYVPPTPLVPGVNSIWQYYDSSSYPYVITSSVPELVQLYGDPEVKMNDIVGSGFNPITLPWSIKYGDEFRFEGREDYVYQVGKIFAPEDTGSGRLTQTGSIEVHFNYNLPVSASSSVFNLDHFSIRRYVDDPSQIIMEGFRPNNSSGPYIVRPEYVVPELDKSIDEFILILKEKGLI
jgi:hypothetical protein